MIRDVAVRIIFWFLDLIYPMRQPLPASANHERRSKQKNDLLLLENLHSLNSERLREILSRLECSIVAEDSRRVDVDSRLSVVLGMASVSSALVLAGIAALYNEGFATLPRMVVVLFFGFGLYAAAQLLFAVLAAIHGLRRRGYLQLALADQIPKKGEPSEEHLHRMVKQNILCLHDNRGNNDDKITELAICQRALVNFVFGMLGLAVVLGAVLVVVVVS